MPGGWGGRAGEGFIGTRFRGGRVSRWQGGKVSKLRALMSSSQTSVSRDWPYYFLGAVCGVGTGWVDVVVDDLLLTALLVTSSCLLLGLLRARWPWRWVVCVGTFIPLTELAAYMVRTVKPTRSQIYGSFLAFLPGIAGAYGGSFMRRVVEN